MELKGEKALVTGGAKGIGKAIAKKFKDEGAEVIVLDLEEPSFDVDYFQVDVRNEKEVKDAFEEVDELDILVNNAGVYEQSPVEDTPKTLLDKVIDTNLKGYYLVSKYAIPLLKETKGCIINISSGLGEVPEPASPAYCSSKAGVNMLTKCMAQEYADLGVRVNAVLAGPIDTDLLRNSFESEREMEEYRKLNPMKRIGDPEDVADVALFLASEKAGFVTGGMYAVDGGESSSSLYS